MPALLSDDTPTGARKWTIIIALLLGFFAYALNTRGSTLEGSLIVQAFALDRYRIQWISAMGIILSLCSIFTSLYLIKLIGARRTYLIGTSCLVGGCLSLSLSADVYQFV